MCSTRSYGFRSSAIFTARTYNVVDADRARTAFRIISSQISHLGKKLTRSRIACNLAQAGKVPCNYLNFPKEEEGCQLAQRILRVSF